MACGRGRPSGSIKRNEPTSIDSQEQTIKRKRGRPFGSFKRKPSPSPSVSPVPKKTRTRTTRNSIRASSRTSTRTSRNSTQLSTQCSTQGDVNDASIQFYISNNVEESADEIERLGSLHQKAYSKVDTAVGSIAEVRLFSLLADRRVNVVFVCGDGVGRVPSSVVLFKHGDESLTWIILRHDNGTAPMVLEPYQMGLEEVLISNGIVREMLVEFVRSIAAGTVLRARRADVAASRAPARYRRETRAGRYIASEHVSEGADGDTDGNAAAEVTDMTLGSGIQNGILIEDDNEDVPEDDAEDDDEGDEEDATEDQCGDTIDDAPGVTNSVLEQHPEDATTDVRKDRRGEIPGNSPRKQHRLCRQQ